MTKMTFHTSQSINFSVPKLFPFRLKPQFLVGNGPAIFPAVLDLAGALITDKHFFSERFVLRLHFPSCSVEFRVNFSAVTAQNHAAAATADAALNGKADGFEINGVGEAEVVVWVL